MLRISEIKLPLDHPAEALREAVLARLAIPSDALIDFHIARRANDARRKSAILMVYSVDVTLADEAEVLARFAGDVHVRPTPDTAYRFVAGRLRPVVIGTGPCGLFAGLILAQMGFRPIILDRGKVVRERTKDTWGLWRRSVLNPESNVQFGEGGAGTFSDGKLYSQIKDPRFLGRKVLTEFVKAGAPPEILTEAHPHIGTFRLVTMVESIRETIEGLGGEYRFGQRVDDIDVETRADGTRAIRGVHLHTGDYLEADHVVLAIGHSARDTFEMLHERGVFIEPKPFSIGVRIEHPQSWIDKARFVVGIDPARDYPDGPLAGIALQRHFESLAYVAGGSTYAAPGQKLGDFLAGRPSTELGDVIPSYKPGVHLTDLAQCLPDFAVEAMREALPVFGRQIPNYAHPDAMMTGVETRTSSPIRITRGKDFQSLNTARLYPAGEGAGYAGGILSAAVDGIKVAEALALSMMA